MDILFRNEPRRLAFVEFVNHSGHLSEDISMSDVLRADERMTKVWRSFKGRRRMLDVVFMSLQ